MKMKKIVALFATTAIILAGCSGAGSQSKEETLNIELPLKTTSIAPYESELAVQNGATEFLFKANAEGKVHKLIVESYNQKSPKKINLKLKDDIKFQNGKKVTGKAVKSSLEESMKQSDLVKGSLPI